MLLFIFIAYIVWYAYYSFLSEGSGSHHYFDDGVDVTPIIDSNEDPGSPRSVVGDELHPRRRRGEITIPDIE